MVAQARLLLHFGEVMAHGHRAVRAPQALPARPAPLQPSPDLPDQLVPLAVLDLLALQEAPDLAGLPLRLPQVQLQQALPL